MTPKKKASELYASAFKLFEQPKTMEDLIRVNNEIKSLNAGVCTIMVDLEPNRLFLWSKTLDLVKSGYF